MDSRERVVRAIEFDCPDRIPVDLCAVPALYIRHGKSVDELLHRYPLDFVYSDYNTDATDPRMKAGEYLDEWGCLWHTAAEGYCGMVVHSPLEDYAALNKYRLPYDEMEASIKCATAGTSRPDKFWLGYGGEFFHRMCWLRGMENVMFDLMDGAKGIYRLRDMLFDFYSKQISLWLDAPVDGITFCDDWGSQNQLLISPELWRSFIKPVYREFFSTIKSAGKHLFFHSDGYITDIIDDFIELGVEALNCQVWCMGPEALGERFAGRIAFWGELDRQGAVTWGTPDEILESARLMKKHLATPKGGLIGQASVDGLTSLENLQACLTAWN